MNSTEVIHHDNLSSQIRRVVAVAVDGSKSSWYALEWASTNLLRSDHDMVILLHCRPSEADPESFSRWKTETDLALVASMIEAHHRQLSHQLLKKATQFLKSKLFSVQSYSLIGDSREEIANKIKDFKVNLLVVGNCGMGIIKRTFVGSTCDYLVHHAHCPVMVVKSRLSGHIPGPEPDETISSQLLQRNLIL